jgi:hypothetical protein
MLHSLKGEQVICLWKYFSHNADKISGLLDTIDFLFLLNFIKITEHENYNYLDNICEYLNANFDKVTNQYFEAI